MTKKPVLAVTGPDQGGTMAWFFTRIAVWRAGGKALRVKPSTFDPLQKFDGLILGGGADISPELYAMDELRDACKIAKSEKNTLGWIRFPFLLVSLVITLFRNLFSLDYSTAFDRQRDGMEQKILEMAVKNNLPVLGICRGAQFINVQFNGSLYPDITQFYEETPKVNTIFPRKYIEIKPESKLAKILQKTRIKVNSLHNQAVHTQGDYIRIVATEQITGIAQAIESVRHRFVIGIQWHPEYLPQIPEQQNLFKELIGQASVTAECNH